MNQDMRIAQARRISDLQAALVLALAALDEMNEGLRDPQVAEIIAGGKKVLLGEEGENG